MRFLPSCLFLFFVLTAAASAQTPSDPDEALTVARKSVRTGVALLKKARSGDGNQADLSRKAMKAFENAQKLFEFYLDKRGENPKVEDEMAEVQSMLYWARKMTPMAEEEEKKKPVKPKVNPERDLPGGENMPAPPPPPPAAKAPEPERAPKVGAQALFEKAQAFEKANPDAHFEISVRYFEVVDRFRSSPYAEKALRLCMQHQRMLVSGKKTPPKADPGQAPKNDGTGRPKTVDPQPSPGTPYEVPEDPTLIRLNLRHPDAKIRAVNIKALVKVVGRAALPDLHSTIFEEMDEETFKVIAGELAKLRHTSTYKLVKERACQRSTEEARRIMRLSGIMGRPEWAKMILICLAVNERAIYNSRQPYFSGFVKPYAAEVARAYAGGLRKEAIEVLVSMGENGIKGLRKCLKGRSMITREAILALGVMKEKKSSGYISVYLQRKNRYAFRSEAMAALDLIGIDAMPYLIRNLTNSTLRIWSAYTLREITGQPWTASAIARWKNYYQMNRQR